SALRPGRRRRAVSRLGRYRGGAVGFHDDADVVRGRPVGRAQPEWHGLSADLGHRRVQRRRHAGRLDADAAPRRASHCGGRAADLTPMHHRPEYICLAGPTAAGKTAAALAIADAFQASDPVEIVSVDSALVYRGMDIGTAKPSAAE